jgi:hypothetical protein
VGVEDRAGVSETIEIVKAVAADIVYGALAQRIDGSNRDRYGASGQGIKELNFVRHRATPSRE